MRGFRHRSRQPIEAPQLAPHLITRGSGSNRARQFSGCLLAQFAQQAVAIGNVQCLQFLELCEKGARGDGIVAIAFQFRYEFALSGHVPFALGDVPFGLEQMFFDCSPIHVWYLTHP